MHDKRGGGTMIPLKGIPLISCQTLLISSSVRPHLPYCMKIGETFENKKNIAWIYQFLAPSTEPYSKYTQPIVLHAFIYDKWYGSVIPIHVKCDFFILAKK